MEVEELICYKCGDLGLPGGCPKCHKDSNKIVVPKKKEEKFIRDITFKQVPSEYVGTVWNSSILLTNHPELDSNMNFKDYVNQLEKLHEKFKLGLLPKCSAYISAPSKMSKTILAFSCMQFALKNGFSVAPLIDTIELQRLITLCGENPKWKLYNYIDYDSYITSDVLFFSVTKTERHTQAYRLVLEVLSRRSRLGLPTFIISKFSLKEIARDCYDCKINDIVDESLQLNPFKYPSIIEWS